MRCPSRLVRESDTEATMRDDELRRTLTRSRYPRSSRYDPAWVLESDMGPNSLWLMEGLCALLPLEPGSRVLDLGCGQASSSIFLAREFGVLVWAVDLIVPPTSNWQRVKAAGVADRVFPQRADARMLSFPEEFFDAVVSVSAYQYFGTDDMYLRHLAPVLVPGGWLGVVVQGVTEEIDSPPDYFTTIWKQNFEPLHSPEWWRRHWERSGVLDIKVVDMVPEGWEDWVAWKELLRSQGLNPKFAAADLQTLQADGGRLLGLVRAVARKQGG
jgi:cyclopropane fatty-acyl-phospholipid synthase-like methyltransferase